MNFDLLCSCRLHVKSNDHVDLHTLRLDSQPCVKEFQTTTGEPRGCFKGTVHPNKTAQHSAKQLKSVELVGCNPSLQMSLQVRCAVELVQPLQTGCMLTFSSAATEKKRCQSCLRSVCDLRASADSLKRAVWRHFSLQLLQVFSRMLRPISWR